MHTVNEVNIQLTFPKASAEKDKKSEVITLGSETKDIWHRGKSRKKKRNIYNKKKAL